ncbi:hypothetical protein BC828DRAFT_391053 [Blastocladiella britannica]|nr:hypothetical protein BC828DRAFT_391053 [Blastocladiella britannica]
MTNPDYAPLATPAATPAATPGASSVHLGGSGGGHEFVLKVADLSRMIDNKDRAAYASYGRVRGIAAALIVDPVRGLCPPPKYTPATTGADLARLMAAAPPPTPTPAPAVGASGDHPSAPRPAADPAGAVEMQPHTTTAKPADAVAITIPPPVSSGREFTLEEMRAREHFYGVNRLPEVKSKTIFELMWDAMQDKTLIFLTCAAIVSLGIGLYEDFGMSHPNDPATGQPEPKIKWVEGVAIIVAVMIVVMVTSVNDWQKERQFRSLEKKADDRVVKVIRHGAPSLLSVYDLLVGDVLSIEPGDVLPADAVLLEGHGVKCDESGATGESDALSKTDEGDAFLLSGSRVLEGTGKCIVVSVGPYSFHGRTMMLMRTETVETPLQIKLNVLAEEIAKLGGAASLLMFIVLISKYLITAGISGAFVSGHPNQQSAPEIVENVTQILITTITVLVVAVPEGLPLAVTLSLAFATKKMLADMNLVRVLAACEVMGNATTICSDKTGTLTQNRMTAVKAHFGHRDGHALKTPPGSPTKLSTAGSPSKKSPSYIGEMTCPEDAARLKSLIGGDEGLWSAINDNIAINSSAFEVVPDSASAAPTEATDKRQSKATPEVPPVDATTGAKIEFVGSKTETALLDMQHRAGVDYASIRSSAKVVHVYPFSSATKFMATLVELPGSPASAGSAEAEASSSTSAPVPMGAESAAAPGELLRLHVKGAPEMILAHCSSVYVPGKGVQPMTPERARGLAETVSRFASGALRTLALAYVDVRRDFLPEDVATAQQPLLPAGVSLGGVFSAAVSLESGLNSSRAHSANDITTRSPSAAGSAAHRPGGAAALEVPSPLRQGVGRSVPEITLAAGSSSRSDGPTARFSEPPSPILGANDPRAEHTLQWAGQSGSNAPGLVLVGIVGIEDPVRPGVPEAVETCQRAGIFVRMVTGDNIATARAIAIKCGIYQQGGVVMEGKHFRKLSPDAMDNIIPRLQVLARSSPADKQLLVERLKGMGETVAVTGDGTNDGPALKLADVGFSMGIAGTEVAKEASSIILMDDNFASIVKAVLWGRAVNDSVRKFLQFQLTVNLTAVVVTFVSAVSSSTQESVLTAVQLLWVNLIMDALAALALATEPPTKELLERHPDSKRAPLITYHMWKMVIGQALFQITVNLLALYIGPQIYGLQSNSLRTVVFNSFIFLQVFNEINCRRLDSRLNVFSGIQNNMYFCVIMVITVVLQVVIVEFGGSAFQTTRLTGVEWAVSIAIGFMSIPVGVIIRLLPDWGYKPVPDDRIHLTKERLKWIGAISTVQTQLRVFSALRSTHRLNGDPGRGSQQRIGGSGSPTTRAEPSGAAAVPNKMNRAFRGGYSTIDQ